jgi:anti-anti-sigma factor
MTAGRFVEFEIAVNFHAEQTIVSVCGEVDLLTAPTLHAAINALVDQGRPGIVLDLTGLTFMDASGLRVIADASVNLATSSRRLTVRSAPAMTRQILDITRVSELIQLEVVNPRVATLGAEQRLGDHSLAVHVQPTDRLRAGNTPRNELIDAALRRVTALVRATVDGADGVSVTLKRDGRLTTVASSNDTVMRMDDHQYETGEGPCLSAAAQGRWFHIESLAEETRWPAFVPRAIDEGIASILSTPLMTVERPLGALNIYSNADRAFGPRQQKLAALFATQASAILADAGAAVEHTGRPMADALLARQTIARAQGVLMAREHITADDAAATIHRSARAGKVPVARHAAAIVASTRTDAASDT